MPHRISIPLLIVALLLPALTIAQWQVNNRVNYQGSAPSVRFAGSIQNQSATAMLPSQVRMATHASGATPSELRMNYLAQGPMSPSGAISYIPPAPNYRKTVPVTSGNYVNTQVSPTGPTAATGWGTPYSGAPAAGSVRYSATPPPPVTNRPYSPSPLVSPSAFASPVSAAPIGQSYGSVRYSPYAPYTPSSQK